MMRKRSQAREIMKEADRNGFSVLDVRHYSTGVRPDGRPAEWAQVTIQTPYTDVRGKYMTAVGAVNLQGRHGTVAGYAGATDMRNMFPFSDMMLTVGGENIEDIAAKTFGGERPMDDYRILDKEGARIPYKQALDSCGRVMSAAVEFPHVFTLDEFREVSVPMQDAAMKNFTEKFGAAMSDSIESRYDKYLDRVRLEISGGAIRYVGKVTSLVEFDRYRDDFEMDRLHDEIQKDDGRGGLGE